MNPRKIKKKSTLCGYSTRHLRRIIINQVATDRQQLKNEEQQSIESAASLIQGPSKHEDIDIEENVDKHNVGESSTLNETEKSSTCLDICTSSDSEDDYPQESRHVSETVVDSVATNPLMISDMETGSQHSYKDEEFLNSDVSSDCSLPELECLRAEYKNTEGDSAYEEIVRNKLEVDSHTSDEDLHEGKNSEAGRTFRKKLRVWALAFRITLVALTALLLILRTIIHVDLPKDARTLLGTPRFTQISEMDGGEYYHFGSERAIKSILREYKRRGKELNHVRLVVNVDGLPIFNSAGEGLWLILCSELDCKKVYPVGAFYGKKKPRSANEFLKPFVEEAINLTTNGLQDENVSVSFDTLICDTPAKAFVLYLKGHTGYDSCSKCLISGEYVRTKSGRKNAREKGRICFPGIGPFTLKNDEDFARNIYQDFDSEKESILKRIPRFGGISSVPLDYMHLILLGVVKRLIGIWLTGPLKVRLGAVTINKISQKILTLRHSAPSEFIRPGRTLLEYAFWKATEFRTFLLYTGPVVLKHILPSEMYSHFLLLHSAVTILVSEAHVQIGTNVDCAHEMLQQFVKDFALIYGKEQVSQNVHNLLHICSDVKKYGALDQFSAIRFENYMSTIKGMIRKGDQPLEQIARRYAEVESAEKPIEESLRKSHFTTEATLQRPHSDGPLSEDLEYVIQQYKLYKNESYSINCNNSKDNCVLLNSGSFVAISNVVQMRNKQIRFVGKELLPSENLYDNPQSSLLSIHIAKSANSTQYSWSLEEVKSKVWKIPCQKGRIVIPLLHTF